VIAAALALLLTPAAARAAEPPPSRAPDKDCAWSRVTDRGLGLALWAEKCDYGFRRVGFAPSEKDAALYEVERDTAPGSAESREAVIRLFAKDAKESIEDAIKRVALDSTPAERRPRCRAVPAKDVRLRAGRAAYLFAPDDDEEIRRKAGGEIPDPPCGELGLSYDGIAYFEYHPAENPRRFAFVVIGQEEHALFDEDSLEFRTPAAPKK
jgi:hypothetical protein